MFKIDFKTNKTIFILVGITFLPIFGTESSKNLQKVHRFSNIFSRIPETPQLVLVGKLSPTELLSLYEHLEPFEKRVQELKKDEEQGSKNKELLDALAYNARQRVAKIFKCDTVEGDNALQNGTCRPLLTSKREDLTPEQRNAQPFKNIIITPDYWVKLLPVVDILNRWFYDSDLWKIYFLQVIRKIEENPESSIAINHRRINSSKNFFTKNLPQSFSSIRLKINQSFDLNEYNSFFERPSSVRTYSHWISHDVEPSQDDGLKNQIKTLYIKMLPACIQKALLSAPITDEYPMPDPLFSVYKDYGIYIYALLDDPYVTKNITDFQEKIKHLTYPPKQVICPRSFTDIKTKETRVINNAPSIFWTA